MMDPEVKEQWVAALRSGEYKQGREMLRKGDSFCCLGVLCDLAVKAGAIPEPASVPGGAYTYGEGIDVFGGSLPEAVMSWAGASFDPEVLLRNESQPLSTLNDRGTSFRQIADLIEEQL